MFSSILIGILIGICVSFFLSFLFESKGLSPWRRIAAAIWNKPNDPTIYGWMEIDVTKVEKILSELSTKHALRITPTHFIGWVCSRALGRNPDANARVIFGHHIKMRETVDTFLQVFVPDVKNKRDNLSGVRIKEADKLSLVDFAEICREKVEKLRKGKEELFSSGMSMGKVLPPWLMRLSAYVGHFLTNELQLNLKWFGLPKDPFGSIMITSLGGFHVEMACSTICLLIIPLVH
eukprot:TRINITY_DN2901_c0_g1_i1.p1 TRINITY_DN2901_c0_g1~~TRINITY_DN2901_c0_g1_i1.p1  ORF type:complete len:235 (+),score=71.91 TRINITY_DN2901_c0_g1_i1:71-775(+)